MAKVQRLRTEKKRKEASKNIQQVFSVLCEKGILETLAEASVIEVILPKFKNEQTHWSLRTMPWEFLLSSVTRPYRRQSGQVIIRVLPVTGTKYRSVKKGENIVPLIVESAPGKLEDIYLFDSERQLIALNLQLKDIAPYLIVSPTSEELREELKKKSPHMLHLTGFDSHQGGSFLGESFDRSRMDGFYLSNPAGEPVSFNADEMAKIITASEDNPALVSFNTYNSASRLCPLAVSEGVNSAIGFQDEVDDRLAEAFFASFYKVWGNTDNHNLLTAFVYAFNETKKMGLKSRLRGSGIVLWSQRSLLNKYSATEAQLTLINEKNLVEQKKRIQLDLHESQTEDASKIDVSGERDLLSFDISPLKRLNYSILHNNGNLFDNFSITKTRAGTLNNVFIEVKLYLGATEFPYKGTFTFENKNVPEDLADKIRIPLGWDSLRTLTESIRL